MPILPKAAFLPECRWSIPLGKVAMNISRALVWESVAIMNYHYTRQDLLKAIEEIGICPGDTVSLHVSLGRLGLPQAVDRNYPALSNFVIDAFLEVLGANGTLLVPTYSYSFSRGQVYEVESTPSRTGEFPEVFRSRTNAVRSRDPMLSWAAIGPGAQVILRNISKQCFGAGCVFENLVKADGMICTLGLGMWWATFCHYIEKMADVPFRVDKRFRGLIREHGREREEEWIYFAKPRLPNCEANSVALERKATERSLINVAPMGRGEIHGVRAREYLAFGLAQLRENPWFTAKGPPVAPELIRGGTMMPIVPKDVIFLPESTPEHPDRWVAMNVFSHTALGISSDVFGLLSTPSAAETTVDGPYRCWNIEHFSNEAGLVADPSRFHRDLRQWQELVLNRQEMLARLRKHCIIVDDEAAYRKRVQPKTQIVDHHNFWNSHQQHGEYMALMRKEDPDGWWMRQKFSPDQLSVRRDTLYGAIQNTFLEEYTQQRIRKGMSVVDLGCGTGVYSNLIASRGASVLGVDPSEEYLAVAREHAREGARFEQMQIGQAGGLDRIPTGSADVVFMSDAILFYYVPFFRGQTADIDVLLADIGRILKPDGAFVSLEPHGAFYLMPWLGAEDRPFVVVTEYLRKSFGIVPPLSWLIRTVSQAGFVLGDMRELTPASYFAEIDPRGYHFASEFPLWHLLEFRPFR